MRKKQYRRKLDIEKQLGMTFRDYALQTDLTQQEMARELGVQPVTVGRWLEADGLVRVVRYEVSDGVI